MTDGETLLLVLALIYLSDCLVWVGQAAWAFTGFWTWRLEARRASIHFAALRGGFSTLNPLPPLGTVFLGQVWPLSLGEKGVAPWSRQSPNPGPAVLPAPGAKFVPWDAIQRVSVEEKKLRVNGELFAVLCSKAHAAALAATLETLRHTPPGERAAAIQRVVRRELSARRAKRRAAFFRRATAWLRVWCSAVFFMTFFLLPFAYWLHGDNRRFFFVAGAVWISMWQVAVEFFCLHRRFYPKLRAERWQHLLLSVVLPHYAIRSLDVLSKGWLAGSHPFAVAAALAAPEEFRRFAGRLWRDTVHPVPTGETGDGAEAAESFHAQVFRPLLREALGEDALAGYENPEPDPVEEGDEPVEPAAPAHCPRCHTPYERAGAPCEDCGGIRAM
ncbi:MAG: hypothetical protein H7A52_07325 [Akkermansiaceae bacterium]|nr:hypothetical protein [Akkermansiaceae bacterium]